MRLSKLPWLLLLLVVAAGTTYAQQPPYLRCSNVSESTVDSVTILDIASKPGDTVYVPIHCGTAAAISGFKMIIRFDTTLLSYVPDPDPANKDKREFGWMTVHAYKPNKPVANPFKDLSSLKTE